MTEKTYTQVELDDAITKALEPWAKCLAHAIKEADGWHDDCRGGPTEDDPIIDQGRTLVASFAPASDSEGGETD